MGGFVRIARRDEIPDGGSLCVEHDGRRVALFRVGDDVHAMDDACSHSGGSLSEGLIDGGEVECPRHAARFSLHTGEPLSPPAFRSVSVYPVRIRGEEVEIEI